MSEQTARNKPAPAPSWVSRLVRLLVLLVLIGSGAAGYIYVWPEVAAFQAKQAEVEQNLASLTKADQSLANDLTALIDAKVKVSESVTSAALQAATSRLSAELDSIRDIEQRAAEKLNEANQLLYRMAKIDQSAWRRAEATFNIRLAGQRLQFAGDVRGALTLLSQADALLRSDFGDDVGAIRSAIAFDRTQLRAVEKLDMVGLMGRLSALDRQIQRLDLSALDPSVRETGSDTISNSDASETSAGTSVSPSLWEQAIDTLASYFVITDLESPQQKPSTSDWSRFAALSIKLNLEQARVALLIRDSESFTDSLARAEVILTELPSSNDDLAMVGVIEELAALSSLSLRLDLPGLETLKLINDERVEGADAINSSLRFSPDSSDNAPASVLK
jgi:uroporphyrin-3 C-methyltransferase